MVKNVFLYVQGGDYSALEFEDRYNAQEVYERMVRDGVTRQVFDNEDHYIEIYIKEFYDIDPKFIEFIRDNFVESPNDYNFIEVDYLEA